jgi:hypothetical protein
MCAFDNYIPQILQCASNWTLAVIAVDRFLTVW